MRQGMTCDELDGPACPPGFGYLLEWFGELSAARTSGAFGANPITFAEINAWAQLTGNEPTPTEVQIMRRLDVAVLAVVNKASKHG